MTTARNTRLATARAEARLSYADLWYRYVGLTGSATLDRVIEYLSDRPVPDGEYDLLAQALNETFADDGRDHPVPYARDLA